MKKIRLLLWLAMAVMPGFACAAQYFVATNGNDNNAGTSTSAPWATFAKAFTKVVGADTVTVACGNYAQSLTDAPPNAHSGTSGNPITFRAATPGCATIVGPQSFAIFFSSVSFVTVDGISVSGGKAVDFANTNTAVSCTASSFAAGGAPNVNTWVEIENSNHITVQNAKFQYAIGYPGIGITGNFLTSGASWITNTAAAIAGTSSFITVKNNVIDHIGNLLDRTATCGDSINLRFGNIDHVLIDGNIFSHSSHNNLQVTNGTNVIAQNNQFDNSWQDLYPAAIFNGITRTGYRLNDLGGSNNLYQNNLYEHAGCCNVAASFIAPLIAIYGTNDIFRRNVFWDSTSEFLDTECGVNGSTSSTGIHIFHNTMVGADTSAITFQAFNTCTAEGLNVFVNNIFANARQDFSHDTPIATSDADVFFILQGPAPRPNVNMGPIGQNLFSTNLWAPSLTSGPAAPYTTRPLLWSAFGSTPEINNLVAENLLFPTFVLLNNIDAGATPAKRPVFVAPIPPTSQRGVYGGFALAAGSPGIDQGQCLTTTTAAGTNSTSIPVADVHFFTEGMGMIPGDVIELCGSGAVTTVTALATGAYPAGTLTVSPAVSFANGAGVSLKFNGSAPDIGAIEFAGTPPATQNHAWNGTSCVSNGRKYTEKSHCPP